MAVSGADPARSLKAVECASERSTQGSDSEAAASTAASTTASITHGKRSTAKPRLRNRFAIESDSESESEAEAADCSAAPRAAEPAAPEDKADEADWGDFRAVTRKKTRAPRPREVQAAPTTEPAATAAWSDSDDDYVVGRQDSRQHKTGDMKRSCGFKVVKQRTGAKEKRDRQRAGLPPS